MTKTNKKRSKQTSKPKAQARRVGAASLDRGAAEYARLIADPCNAPLVHPTYSGTEGGYLVRTESFYTIATGAADTATYLQWTPGLVGNGDAILDSWATGGDVSAGPASNGAKAPGYTFLIANANAVRCVAACMKISYVGSESARSGRLHVGHVSGATITSAARSPNVVASALTHYTRTPAQEVELIWKPGDGDQLFRGPGGGYTISDAAMRQSLCLAAVGLPVATGLTIRMTAVYEWQPIVTDQLSTPSMSKNMSDKTLDQVINVLIRGGFSFVKGVVSGGGGLPAGIIAALSATMGTMPATLSKRALAQLGM